MNTPHLQVPFFKRQLRKGKRDFIISHPIRKQLHTFRHQKYEEHNQLIPMLILVLIGDNEFFKCSVQNALFGNLTTVVSFNMDQLLSSV